MSFDAVRRQNTRQGASELISVSSKQARIQRYFGMRVHAKVDAGRGYMHTITGTAAKVYDVTQAHALIRDDDEVGYGDSGYFDVEKRTKIREDEHLSKVVFRIYKRPSSIKATGLISNRRIPGKT